MTILKPMMSMQMIVVADADDKVETCVGNDTSCYGADGSDGCSVVSGISAISCSTALWELAIPTLAGELL